MLRHLTLSLTAVTVAVGALVASPRQATSFMPVDQIRPGMVGVGRTVYAGDALEEFKVNIIGVLRNVMGPRRDLILAKLEGGPLANTGVIQGMSGSPVFIDGRLIGAVSYALGSFAKEPFAGITPIGEMISAVDGSGPRVNGGGLDLAWPATAAEVFGSLRRLADRAAAPLRTLPPDMDVLGPAALADLAPSLRPIGVRMIMSGFDPGIDRELRQALLATPAPGQAPPRAARTPDAATLLRPGDPVGVSLIRGDVEMGATGTVTYVDGSRVYGFGHPFLNLGPLTLAMTRAHVYAVLPSLDSSFKIASMGPVIGTLTQDRATAVGGTLGPGPRELEATVTLSTDHGPDRTFNFHVLQDALLTPLFSYVAVVNVLASYERQTGPLSVAVNSTVSFGPDGKVTIDDFFSGDGALTSAATGAVVPIGVAATNEFRKVTAETLDVRLRVSERQESSTIERAWLDTTKPKFGATYPLQVLMRDYRGGTQIVSIPITMPMQGSGPLTLLVSDAPTLAGMEQREIKPGKPTNFAEVIAQLNATRRNNRLYVRLLSASPGTVVGGETMPALPGSVRSVLDADKSVPSASLSRTVVGAWEQRLDRVVRGSRELTLTLTSSR